MNKTLITLCSIVTFVSIPLISFAASDYVPLVGVPGLDVRGTNIEAYIQALYTLSIVAASILVVIKIIGGGVKYMLTDVVTTKGEAKQDIQGAIFGLLIILSTVLILDTILIFIKNSYNLIRLYTAMLQVQKNLW